MASQNYNCKKLGLLQEKILYLIVETGGEQC
ncbi:hypothetical protein NIES2098_61860 [Calothrix sp. NIES-2098]|nr:hypothetical protein NIES2098_61860 [Calothrix sp. NIES-2098]